jgi:hypothetical protein
LLPYSGKAIVANLSALANLFFSFPSKDVLQRGPLKPAIKDYSKQTESIIKQLVFSSRKWKKETELLLAIHF